MDPSPKMRIALKLIGTESWFEGDIEGVLRLVTVAESAGVDIISIPEHVVMSDDFSGYPYPARTISADDDFYEPMVLLAVIAARTRRIRLSTGVLLLPLRPAVLIAKQAATLDVISGGRVELSVGVGWQKAEYDFEGLPWEGRFGRMMETIEACRCLWAQAPASYKGKYISFERAYSKPFPIQRDKLPILLGVGPSQINIERLASMADGWEPAGLSSGTIATAMGQIRSRMVVHGRDPALFRVRVTLPTVAIDGRANIEATLAQLPELVAAGCTEFNVNAYQYCSGPHEYESFLRTVTAARDSLGRLQ